MDKKTWLIVGIVVVIIIILLVIWNSEAWSDEKPYMMSYKTEPKTQMAQPMLVEPPSEPSLFGPESDIEFGEQVQMNIPTRISRRQRTYNLKPSKHTWMPGIYKRDALLYGVKTTLAQVLQETFDEKSLAEAHALSYQAHFGPERVVYAVENGKGNLSWEYFFYGLNPEHSSTVDTPDNLFKTANSDLKLSEYMKYHQQFMPNDTKWKTEELSTLGLSAYSFKVSESGLKNGKTDGLFLHYIVGDEISSPCKTVHNKLTEDGHDIEVGFSILFCPSCFHDFTYQAQQVGLSDLDIGTLETFAGQNSDDVPKFIRVSNNKHEMSLHLIGVSGSDFLKFLQRYDYPDFLVSYVQSNLIELDNFKHEIAFDFMRGGGSTPVRTRFFGIL